MKTNILVSLISILFFNRIDAQTSIFASQNNENISYYNFIPDQSITCSNIEDCYKYIEIDINNDSIIDFKLISYYGFSNEEGLETNMIETLNSNEIAFQTLNTTKMVKVFNQNDIIDNSVTFTKLDAYLKYKYLVGATNIDDEVSSFQDKYIAVKIKKDENFLYGWIKLNYENSTITVKETGVSKVNPNSVSEIQNDLNIDVFPNPNNGVFSIEIKNSDLKTIEIFDNLGKNIYYSQIKNNKQQIEIQQKGLYFVRVKSENYSFTKKIVVF